MKKMLLKSGFNEDETMFYGYNSGEELLNSVQNCGNVNLLILDMQMKNMNGNVAAKKFRKYFPLSVIVFCSGVCMPTVEAFESNPFRYLLKEYTDDRMLKELQVIVQEIKKRVVEPDIRCEWKYSTVLLKPEEILYIAIDRGGSKVFIHPDVIKHEFEKNIKCRLRVPELYNQLKDFGFEYAHNSYIVNMNYIKIKTVKEIELVDGTILSVSRSREKQLRMAFAKWKGKKY
jgi:DNA-binding LytR/AlgR family response regulator